MIIDNHGDGTFSIKSNFKFAPAEGLSDDKVRELADKHLSYITYDEGEYGVEIEITGELEFYDAIIAEINRINNDKIQSNR